MSDVDQDPVYNFGNVSYKNKILIENSEECSCYHCLKVFSKDDIKVWADEDETATCPKCGMDAVLHYVPDLMTLQKAHTFWFSPNWSTDVDFQIT